MICPHPRDQVSNSLTWLTRPFKTLSPTQHPTPPHPPIQNGTHLSWAVNKGCLPTSVCNSQPLSPIGHLTQLTAPHVRGFTAGTSLPTTPTVPGTVCPQQPVLPFPHPLPVRAPPPSSQTRPISPSHHLSAPACLHHTALAGPSATQARERLRLSFSKWRGAN